MGCDYLSTIADIIERTQKPDANCHVKSVLEGDLIRIEIHGRSANSIVDRPDGARESKFKRTDSGAYVRTHSEED